jgi:hypothetical protein
MLFRTVYGPELVAVYNYLAQANKPIPQQTLYEVFLAPHAATETLSTQSIDDALAFLLSASLISQEGRSYQACQNKHVSPRLFILHQLCRLARREIDVKNQLDPLYMQILDEVFIKNNRLFVEKLHPEVNKLQQVKDIGGLNQEKIQAWKRVMTFLGVGKRVGSGFLCVYAPDLVEGILREWNESSSSLHSFLEDHLNLFLPFKTLSQDLAQPISETLLNLAERGVVVLESRQDSPSRAYFGEKKFQYITYIGGSAWHKIF